MSAFKLFMILIALVVVISAVPYYVLNTTSGLDWAVRKGLERFVKAEFKSVERIKGSLRTVITLENVELRNVEGLPASTLRIQTLHVWPHGWDYKNADIQVINARLILKVSDNIVINGKYQKQSLDASVFCSSLDVQEVLKTALPKNLHIQGGIKNADFRVQGPLSYILISGPFHITKLSKADYLLTDAPGSLALQIFEQKKELRLKGQVTIDKGSFKSKKTKITLKKSSIYFSEDPQNPGLAIDGYSTVDDVDIDLQVKGSAQKPDLILTSDPPMSKEVLMIMLATGKKWQGIEDIEKGQLPKDFVKDFVSYLFFSGNGEGGFLQKLGIKDVDVTVETNKKAIGITKEINKDLDVGYKVSQERAQADIATTQSAVRTSQTMGVDYKLSNKLYVGVERQTPIGDASNSATEDTDNRLLLKYKKRF